MYYPELETLEKMNLDDCDLVPIKKEIYSDMIDEKTKTVF